MKAILLGFLLLAAAGCKDNGKGQTPVVENTASVLNSLPDVLRENVLHAQYNYDTLSLEGALVNGHKIVLPQKTFEKIYGTLDSAKTDLWECGSPFGYLDDAWMAKTYGAYDTSKGEYGSFNGYFTTLFVQKASFASNGHIVLFDGADAAGNTFSLVGSGITLDKNTTLETFESAFPKLLREPGDNPQECRYRISLGKQSDDAFLFYFKEGRLDYFTLWWLLC